MTWTTKPIDTPTITANDIEAGERVTFDHPLTGDVRAIAYYDERGYLIAASYDLREVRIALVEQYQEVPA